MLLSVIELKMSPNNNLFLADAVSKIFVEYNTVCSLIADYAYAGLCMVIFTSVRALFLTASTFFLVVVSFRADAAFTQRASSSHSTGGVVARFKGLVTSSSATSVERDNDNSYWMRDMSKKHRGSTQPLNLSSPRNSWGDIEGDESPRSRTMSMSSRRSSVRSTSMLAPDSNMKDEWTGEDTADEDMMGPEGSHQYYNPTAERRSSMASEYSMMMLGQDDKGAQDLFLQGNALDTPSDSLQVWSLGTSKGADATAARSSSSDYARTSSLTYDSTRDLLPGAQAETVMQKDTDCSSFAAPIEYTAVRVDHSHGKKETPYEKFKKGVVKRTDSLKNKFGNKYVSPPKTAKNDHTDAADPTYEACEFYEQPEDSPYQESLHRPKTSAQEQSRRPIGQTSTMANEQRGPLAIPMLTSENVDPLQGEYVASSDLTETAYSPEEIASGSKEDLYVEINQVQQENYIRTAHVKPNTESPYAWSAQHPEQLSHCMQL